MLLPALNSAREKARAIACLGNMKSCGIALSMYAGDFQDYYPSPMPPKGNGLDGQGSAWPDNRNWGDRLRGQNYLSGKYDSLRCPSLVKSEVTGHSTSTQIFGMNPGLIDWGTNRQTRILSHRQNHKALRRKGKEAIVLTDSRYKDDDYQSPYIGMGDAGTHLRHAGGSNVLLEDGSAGHRPRLQLILYGNLSVFINASGVYTNVGSTYIKSLNKEE